VGEGTGLGLYVSYLIIKQHQGTIHLNSGPQRGAEFVISLPALC
jgi:signal transduction histidine kinase